MHPEQLQTPDSEPVPVCVIDDRPLVVAGVSAVLASAPAAVTAVGVVIVGRTRDALAVVRSEVEQGRRVVVLLDGVHRVCAAQAALDAGARGVALLNQDAAGLLDVVARVAAGGTALADGVEQQVAERQQLLRLFTPREREVLRLYASGALAETVARRMGITGGTVKTYLKRVRAKGRKAGIPVATRVELAALARRLGLG